MNVLFVGPTPAGQQPQRPGHTEGLGRMELAERIEALSKRLDALEKALTERPPARSRKPKTP